MSFKTWKSVRQAARLALAAFVSVVAATLPAAGAPQQVRAFSDVALGQTGEAVVEKLGTPTQISSDFELPQEVAPSGAITYSLCDGAQLVLLIGKIAPMQARVVQVTVHGSPCAEAMNYKVDGIGLGATEKEITDKFGEPGRVIEREDVPFKTIAYNESNVAFNLSEGKLVGISVVYRNQMMVDDLTADGKLSVTDAWRAIGNMRLTARQMDLAREAFEHVIKAQPDSIDDRVKLAGAHFALNDLEKASAQYQQVLAKDASNAVATYNMGRIAIRNKKPDEAAQLLQKAASLDPTNPAVYNELGLLAESTEKLDEAEKHFRKASELSPDASQPHQNWGRILVRKGQTDAAIDHYRQAIILELRSTTPNRGLISALRTAIDTLENGDTEAGPSGG